MVKALVILDGVGVRQEKKGNAVLQQKMPCFDFLRNNFPSSTLFASGKAVGLPEEFQGNSEVGHLTLGSGRIIKQDEVRISEAIKSGKFFKKLDKAIKGCNTLHVMGLMSDQGVHSHINHAKAILQAAKQNGLSDVCVHFFSDGRDTAPNVAKRYLDELQKEIKRLGIGRICTVTGRYYAMDRDKRWDRTKLAYDAIVNAKGKKVDSPEKAIKESYKEKVYDEFIKPSVVKGYEGMKNGDAVIFFNFRLDRARQLTKAMCEDEFSVDKPNIRFIAMTQYYKGMNAEVLFEQEDIKNHLGAVVSQNGMKQLRISETEKYAHVTFFFNGLIEEPWKLEDRIMVPSPKVATYDMKPEMSVYEVTEKLVPNLGKYDMVIVNLVNGDMVGHTGKVMAARKGLKAIDECLQKIYDKIVELDGEMLVTADHGNCEDMTGALKTSHTTNKVPFIVVSSRFKLLDVPDAGLSNVAPTMLHMLGLKKPKEMTGESLVK